MPHLSPMSWISFMLMIWTSVWLMMVSMWWNPMMKFKMLLTHMKFLNMKLWGWY